MNPQMPPPTDLAQPHSVQIDGSSTIPPSASHNVPEVFQDMVNQNPPPVQSQPETVSTPLSAGDGDVIEKVWVEKAEHVIDGHKYDPYNQVIAAQALNQEYLKQRFGLDVHKSQDGA